MFSYCITMYSFRKIKYNDIFKIKEIRNEQMDVLRQSKELTDKDQENWYNNVILPSYKDQTKTLNFTILYENEFIGYGGLVYIDYVNKNAEISFLVKKERTINTNIYDDDFTHFLKFITNYAYNNLNLHRLWTETYEYRKFHISILEKNMFKREGVLKHSIYVDNIYYNSIIHGLILDDKINEVTNKNNMIDYKSFLKNKTIFITGGAGLIGTDLILKLSELNVKKIICVDLKPMPVSFNNIEIEYYQQDATLLEIEFMQKLDPEIIFHLAATFERTSETLEFWEENYHHNIKLSNHIGTICKNLPNLKRVIFTSSYLIYNSELYSFNEPQITPIIINEDTPVKPRNICGASKLLHEVELNFFSHFDQYKFTCVTPRIFRVYGPGECGRLGGTIINRWITSLLEDENKPLDVFAKDGIFDYIYSEDIAFSLILLSGSEHTGVINLGRGQGRTIMDVLNILKGHFPNLKYNEIKSNINYEACQSNMDLFYKITGWKPTTNLEEGINKCIHAIKNNKI